tara:strand:+ start:44 stop:607 length:564 start_codon:yes stop_codon:yes gene_type:complete
MKNKTDSTDYYWFKKIFSDEEIELIKKQAGKIDTESGTTFGGNKEIRTSEVSWITYDEDSAWIYKRITECMKYANDEAYHFDWNGATEAIQFTLYHSNEKGHYDYHIDMGPEKGDYTGHLRKISAVVMLNDDYEGGELEIWGKDLTQTYGKGNCVVFPSFLLHRVKPVTKGTRNSLVIWGIGDESFK